jgi:peptidyl-tRNA hydrolase, PTH1 family
VADWIIAGLGNPGAEYDWTPHNLGFLAVDLLAERHQIRISRPEGQALVGVGRVGQAEVVLMKPQTFMNLSGGSVKQILNRYECGWDRMLVAYDDLALEWGALRIRERGSAGGHNGVKSIISSAGSDEFPRVRIGCKPDHPLAGGKDRDYVLSPIRKAAQPQVREWLATVADAMECIIAEGAAKAMNRFNVRAQSSSKEEA